MDICHLKNAELEPNLQMYKGRVVLRVDIVNDDSGACAVFTEQGSSASQMTAVDGASRSPTFHAHSCCTNAHYLFSRSNVVNLSVKSVCPCEVLEHSHGVLAPHCSF